MSCVEGGGGPPGRVVDWAVWRHKKERQLSARSSVWSLLADHQVGGREVDQVVGKTPWGRRHRASVGGVQNDKVRSCCVGHTTGIQMGAVSKVRRAVAAKSHVRASRRQVARAKILVASRERKQLALREGNEFDCVAEADRRERCSCGWMGLTLKALIQKNWVIV